jgi:hypothetical protein
MFCRQSLPGLFLILLTLQPLAAGAQLHLVASIDNAVPLEMNSASIRIDQSCALAVVLQRKDDSGSVRYHGAGIETARIGDKTVVVEAWPGGEPPAVIRWYKVEPLMMHAERGNDPTVPGYLWYTNAYTPESPNGQRWIGFDKIDYRNTPLPEFDDQWLIPADARPTDRRYDRSGGMGTMRYRVELRAGDRRWSTPGAGATNYLGVEDSVFKLLVRADDSFVGHATTWCNVPGVFGSHRLQVDRHIGIDCADLIVGAYRQWKGSGLEYTNVNGLPDFMTKVGKPLFLTHDGNLPTKPDGRPAEPVAYERGLVIMLDYPGTVAEHYDHVVMLYRDNGNGVVDGDDVILQCGPMEPIFSRLVGQAHDPGRPTRMQILRWPKTRIE